MKEKKSQIEITLLSDLLVSYGTGYNSMIDQDVCYDSYGLLLIPAKRLKGCLREAALELVDWGKNISIKELFGAEGDQEGRVLISNAFLKEHERYRKELEGMDKRIGSPQAVLNQFTDTRTQTSIDPVTGKAEEGLRVSRVAVKGLVFTADAVIRGVTEEEIAVTEASLADCCKALRRMGCERTRGLGEVAVRLIPGEFQSAERVVSGKYDGKGQYRLDYSIYLNSAVIVKSETGGMDQAQDYLPGALMLGKIARWANEEKKGGYQELMEEGELICSNAYIASCGERMVPISAALFIVKNRESEVRDLTCLEEEKNGAVYQMKSPGTCYIDGNTEKNGKEKLSYARKKVLLETAYHHSRPADKSIGRVIQNSPESQLYQLGSICAGQEFSGFVIGNGNQIGKVYNYLKAHGTFRMGYNCSAEYGEVTLSVKEPKKLERQPVQKASRFVVKLEAPLMEYDDQGRYTTDVDVLTGELEYILERKIRPVRTFFRYQSTGGYNRTWQMRKPVIDVWDKGTCIVYETEAERPADIGRLQNCFLGERVSEGYGEISVYLASENREKTMTETEEQTDRQPKQFIRSGELYDKLLASLAKSYIENQARQKAREDGIRDMDPALVNCMISMCRENGSANLKGYLERNIQERYGDKRTEKKIKKSEIARHILRGFQEDRLRGSFEKEYHCPLNVDTDCLAAWYYPAYLIEMKYNCRSEKQKGR